jgi:hypothetical protein
MRPNLQNDAGWSEMSDLTGVRIAVMSKPVKLGWALFAEIQAKICPS